MSAGLVIGIPTLLSRPVHIDWALAFKGLNPPINYNVVFSIVKNQPVADARNIIADVAVQQGAKYLFFLGDDTIPPPHALKQLIYRMEQNPDIGVCGGVYCSKSTPPAPLVFRGNGIGSYWDWKVGEFFQVTGIGMDCTLIRVSILSKLEKPWFVTVDKDSFLDAENKAETWTEDLFFCKRVTDAGFNIFCDTGVVCDHIDIFTGKNYTIPAGSLPTRQAVADGKKIVDLGCGPIKREIDGVQPIRVDIDERWEPDYRADVRCLPFDNNEFDIVFSSHVLEHISHLETEATLKEWIRILKPGGLLRIIVPNIAWAAARVNEWNDDVRNVFYGAHSSPYDKHQTGFTPTRLASLVESLGCKVSSLKEEGYNILLEAIKD